MDIPTPKDKDMNPENECPICMINLNTEDVTQMKCCKQNMHTRCYMQCIYHSKNQSCPLCRNSDHSRTLILEATQSHTIINIPAPVEHGYDQNSACQKVSFIMFSTFVCIYTVIIYLHT